jgi:glycosyltransferase involved in cell wall biosynthesis
MKRIVFFTPSLNIGGIERVFLTYSEALIQRGYDVSYLICHENGDLSSIVPKGMEVLSLGNIKLTKSLFPLVRFFKKNPVDVFITGGEIPNSLSILAGILAGSKSKIIISHHNYFNVDVHEHLLKLLIKLFYNKASHIISVSDGITRLLLSRGIKKNVVTIYNPVDLSYIRTCSHADLNIALPPKYLLFIGRLGKVKNLPLLMDAYRILEKKDPFIELVLAGEGPMKETLENRISKYGLSKKVHFLGALENPFPIMKNASAVVLSSSSEALPTVILESFALGKTVISTPTNGALDLLEDGNFGYLSTTFNNAKEFASAIELGLSKPIPATLLDSRVAKFSIDAKVEELIKLF